MIMKILTFILLIFFNSFALADPLKNAIESEIRSDKNVARDCLLYTSDAADE